SWPANIDADFAKSIRDVDFVAVEGLAFPCCGLAVGNSLQTNCDDCLCGVQAPARAIFICHRTAPLFSSTPHVRCVRRFYESDGYVIGLTVSRLMLFANCCCKIDILVVYEKITTQIFRLEWPTSLPN